jgi:MFS family permease
MLRRPTLSGANAVILLLTAVVAAQGFYSTFLLQQALGYSAIATGLAFLPIALIILLFSTISPRLAFRFGTRRMLIVGMALIALAMLSFARVPSDANYYVDLLPGFVGLAVGMGLSFFSATVAATTGVPNHLQGVASGLINTSAQVGSALGLALLISVGAGVSSVIAPDSGPSATLLVAFRAAHACGALIAAIATIIAIKIVRPGLASG